MKMYATVSSERATKGQGGNNHLDIDIFVGSSNESKKIIEGTITPEGNGYVVYITTLGQGDDDQCIDTIVKVKAEQKKGETCLTCGDSGWLSKSDRCLNCNPLGNH